MSYLVGIDGGGTRTTLAIADAGGREIVRRSGPSGLVDPRRPSATADLLVSLVREAALAAGFEGPALALCAGLAGVGNRTEREIVERTLARSGVAGHVAVRSDGETALIGALGGRPGLLLIAGTGSVAYGRAVDGRVERCGGWGMMLGDEGSGFAIARAGLHAALLSVDGRGPATRLLPVLLEVLGLAVPDAVPPWFARAEKAEVASLAVHVIRTADEGDRAALDVVAAAARDLAAHADALVWRLGPWLETPTLALHGGVATDPIFSRHLRAALELRPEALRVIDAEADAVAGALIYAGAMVDAGGDAAPGLPEPGRLSPAEEPGDEAGGRAG
jgi:glucosamine kinase